MLTPHQIKLHETAKRIAKDYHRVEGELLDILQQIDSARVYLALGYSSLFKYSIAELNLTEQQAYPFMAIARKAVEIPALKAEIKTGELTVFKAARIVSVLTPQNQNEWISKAINLPKAEVEREVAKVNPEAAKREAIRRFDEKSFRIALNLSEEAFAKLKRVQVLESTRQRKNISLEEVISQMSELYLHHKDPVKRSERVLNKKKNLKGESGRKIPPSKGIFSSARLNDQESRDQELQRAEEVRNELCPGKVRQVSRGQGSNGLVKIERKSIPAPIKHRVMQRDRGVCRFQATEGKVCGNPSFIEIHHLKPISEGGSNELSNLTTFCAKHHRFHHQRNDKMTPPRLERRTAD